MPSTYSPNLRIELIANGEQSGTWGTTTNTNLGTLIEDAISGYVSVSITSADQALTAVDGGADQSRNMIINLTTTTSAAFNVYIPPAEKFYVIRNSSAYDATIYCSTVLGNTTAAGTGVTVLAGTTTMVFADGTNVASSLTAFSGNLVVSANSSSPALRVTQTGSGDAILVEDSANPDATPFVVDANGRIVGGYTSSITIDSAQQKFELVGNATDANFALFRYQDSANAPIIYQAKARGTVASPLIVQSSDTLGVLGFFGHDGTAFVRGAQIAAAVDGTPGLNDMPGRLLFSTTASGSATPTERMRIDNQGRVGIGTTSTESRLVIGGTLVSSAVNSRSVWSNPTVPSGNTGFFINFHSEPQTAAASFTVAGEFTHFKAQHSGTFGAGSSVTNQYGYFANSGLTGATNNYGFYGNIAAGTGRWNFYANGTAENFFGGATTISVNSASDALRITQTGAGNALLVEDSANPDATPFVVTSIGDVIIGHTTGLLAGSLEVIGTDDATTRAHLLRYDNNSSGSGLFWNKSRNAIIGSHTIVQNGDSLGYAAFRGSDGVSFVNGAQIEAFVDGTPGTNDMPGRLVFSTTADGASTPTERMRIDNQGRVGIGTTSLTGYNVYISKNITGAVGAYNLAVNGTVQSDVTSSAYGVSTYLQTQAASFTVGTIRHFSANQGTIGSGSTVSNQFGFEANSSLTGATNNYGFYSNIASGTGRWNFYANGTAANYFAGQAQFANGAVGTPSISNINDTNTGIFFPAADTIAFSEGGVESMRIDSAGNLGLGVTPSAWSIRALQVGSGFAAWSTAVTNARLFGNTYYDGAYKYVGTGRATQYEMDGYHAWYTSASGTAGNAITFTQAMTLDASNRLLIGTTTAVNDNNLQIQLNAGSNQSRVFAVNRQDNYGLLVGYNNTTGADYGIITVVPNTPLLFSTNNTERARITSGGYFKASNTGTYFNSTAVYHELRQSATDTNLAIFTHTAASPYGIDITFTAATPNNTTNYFLVCGDSTNVKAYVYSTGTISNRTGTYNSISDLKLKQDVVDANSQWDDIKALRIVKYRLKDEVAADPNYPAYIGLIAQEVEQVSPGLIDNCPDFENVEVTDEEGNVTTERRETGTVTKSVKSSIVYMKAVKALQEAMDRIEKLEAEVALLKGAK